MNKLQQENADLRRRIVDLLEVNIKEKRKKIATYAKLEAGKTFEPKESSWYRERKEALQSEIAGHLQTIKSVR